MSSSLNYSLRVLSYLSRAGLVHLCLTKHSGCGQTLQELTKLLLAPPASHLSLQELDEGMLLLFVQEM